MAACFATYRLLIPVENALQKAHLSTMWNESADLIGANQHVLITPLVPIESGGRVDQMFADGPGLLNILPGPCNVLEEPWFRANRALGQTEFRDAQRFWIRSNSAFTVFFDSRSVLKHAAGRAWCVACMYLKRVAFRVESAVIVTVGRTDEATVSTTLGAVIIDLGDGRTVRETTWIFGNQDFWNRTP